MIKIRIQNDLTFRITVTRKGLAETLDGKDLKLIAKSQMETQVLSFTYEDNVITSLWYGTAQTRTGIYTVTLVENYGTKSQNTVDSVQAFALVPLSCQEEDVLTGDQIIDLDLDISVPANGLSAYDLAKLNGYSGTQEEWLASLSQASEDAAKTATSAAEEAQTQGDYAKEQGDYAKEQGDYAKTQGDNAQAEADYAKAQGDYAKAQGTAAEDAATIAEKLNANTPKIKNGTWWVFSLDEDDYVDTGVPATGSIVYPTFYVSTTDMCLYMAYEEEAADAAARIALDEETGQLTLKVGV